MKSNIYLDIDGVLLANDHHAALHVDEFIAKCIERGEKLYWLTTWCRDMDSAPAIRRLKQTDMNPATIELLATHCLPTHWAEAKTEAIDFSQPFLWFDDDCFAYERDKLKKHGVLDNWIDVRLHEDEHHLQKFVQSFPLTIKSDRIRKLTGKKALDHEAKLKAKQVQPHINAVSNALLETRARVLESLGIKLMYFDERHRYQTEDRRLLDNVFLALNRENAPEASQLSPVDRIRLSRLRRKYRADQGPKPEWLRVTPGNADSPIYVWHEDIDKYHHDNDESPD